MAVRILGGGFGEPAYMGDLWDRGESQFQLDWNEEIGGCGDHEPLADSTQLYLCGSGVATVGDSMISGAMVGQAYIKGAGPEVRCAGSSQFRFVRQAR
jgi:hypothetical protein